MLGRQAAADMLPAPTIQRPTMTPHRLQQPDEDFKYSVQYQQHPPVSLQSFQMQRSNRVYLGTVDALLERERARIRALHEAGEDTGQPGGPPGTEIGITINMPKGAGSGNC